MKTIKYTAMALLAGIIMLSSCSRHDFIYENTITGFVGPQSNWNLGSSSVRAGGNVDFRAQYYTTTPGATIHRVEVWYDVVLIENTSVTSRHMTGFDGFNDITTVTRVRIPMLTHTIYHDLSNPNIFRHERAANVFVMEETFPVDDMLTPYSWDPETFNARDSTRMKELFGDTFMADFKQAMRNAMRRPDFERMLVTNLGLMESADFNLPHLVDSVQRVPQYKVDEHGNVVPDWSDRTNIIWFFPGNVVVDGVVQVPVNIPAEIEEVFNTVTFQQLVQAADGYSVSYAREYQLNAHLRIFERRPDGREVFSTTRIWQIDVQ